MTTAPVVSVTDELIAELEAAANAATPGPWVKSGPGEVSSSDYECEGETMCDHISSGFGCGSSDPDDASFVAKANPATIKALLAHIAELKRDAERLDFLESHPEWLRMHKKHWRCVNPATGYEYPVFRTAREAIDHAMKAEG